MCGASSGADSESGVVRKADRHPRHHPRRGHRACLRSGRERGIESISAVLQIRTQKCARSAGCEQLLHEEEEIRASSQQRKTRTSCYLPTINDAHLLHARHDEPDGLDGAGGRLFLMEFYCRLTPNQPTKSWVVPTLVAAGVLRALPRDRYTRRNFVRIIFRFLRLHGYYCTNSGGRTPRFRSRRN